MQKIQTETNIGMASVKAESMGGLLKHQFDLQSEEGRRRNIFGNTQKLIFHPVSKT